MTTRKAITLLLLFIALVGTLQAKERFDIQAEIDQTIDKMNLEPAQKQPTRKILEESVQKRLEVLERYGIDLNSYRQVELGMKDVRRMRSEIDAIKEQTEKELSTVLDSDQMTTFRESREVNAQKMRAEIRKRVK